MKSEEAAKKKGGNGEYKQRVIEIKVWDETIAMYLEQKRIGGFRFALTACRILYRQREGTSEKRKICRNRILNP